MRTQPIAITVLGAGPLAERLAQQLKKRADLRLVAVLPSTQAPASDTDCVIYLPTSIELASGSAANRVSDLLRAGFDVVTSAPIEALSGVDLIGACGAGASTFHGTGGFQGSLATRFNRAFASITRNIREVELIEELDVGELPVHPWMFAADTGFAETDPDALQVQASAVDGYYRAGLHMLSDAVFGDRREQDPVASSAVRARQNDEAVHRERTARAQDSAEQVIVRRTLGSRVAYDSVWTQRQGGDTPLRYRLNTTSADAIGHVTISFQAGGDVHPADHLTCLGLLEAVRPVFESTPGILHQDLDIYHVQPNDCLAR